MTQGFSHSGQPVFTSDFTSGGLDSRLIHTRASNAWYFNAAGALTQAAENAPRFDYDPTTHAARGLLLEGSSKNWIRNSTMVGASAPSTDPTYWSISSADGLSHQVVGTTVANGITYLDVRFYGTATNTVYPSIAWETTTGVPAANSETWTDSVYLAMLSGGTYGTDLGPARLNISKRDSDGSGLTGAFQKTITLSETPTRFSQTVTTDNASVAYLYPYFNIAVSKDEVVDFTIRVGLPQFEKRAVATSPIPTSGTALTRAADIAYIPAEWISQEFSIAYEFMLEQAQSWPSILSVVNAAVTDSVTFTTAAPAAIAANVMAASSLVYSKGIGNITPMGISKAGIALSVVNGASSVLNGGTVNNGALASYPSGLYRIYVNDRWTPRELWVRKLTYWGRALSATELQKATQ